VHGVVLQGRGLTHRTDSDGDGAPAGLTSRFDPAEQRKEGSRVRPAPLRGHGTLAVLKWAARCHGADTGLGAQSSTVAGMGSPQGVGGTALGRGSQARDGAALPSQSIKCSYPSAGAGALVREPRARRSPLEGGVSPRVRRNLLEGGAWLGRSGPRGPPQREPRRVCVLKLEVCFVLFFAGFKLGSPSFLGSSGLSRTTFLSEQISTGYQPPAKRTCGLQMVKKTW
jgi:hypothetical protein